MENWPVNPVDAFVLGAVVLSGILALIRGLVREVMSLASWTIAAYIGVKLAPMGKGWGLALTSNETFATAIGGTVIFFVVLVCLTIISYTVAKAVRESALSTVDRTMGFLFGAARGFLVAVLIYMGGMMLFAGDDDKKDDLPKWLTEAQSEPTLHNASAWLKGVMPEDMKADLDKSIGLGKELAGASDEDKKKQEESEDPLKRLTIPTPEAGGESGKPEYDDTTREQLDQLIDSSKDLPAAQPVTPVESAPVYGE